MNKKLQNILNALSKENLVEIINTLHADKNSCQLVEQQIASFDPKELAKIINTTINSIKRSKKFLGYDEAISMAEKIDHINDGIEKLLQQNNATLALELCQKLIAIDGKIYEHADDSSGNISQSYYDTHALLDKAFCDAKTPHDQIADYIFNACINDDYGISGHILYNCKAALKLGADKPLEQLVLKKLTPESYLYFDIRLVIADARNDVDEYISIEDEHWQHIGAEMDDKTILAIAKRLNNAFRGREAIAWLEKINDHHYQYEKAELLIEAHQLEGMDSKAQEILWQRFKSNLSAHDYLRYLKNADQEQRQTAKVQAIELCMKFPYLSSSIDFLSEVKEFALLEDMVLKNTEQLKNVHSSAFRKISTELAKNNKYLAATLMRRTLVWDILNKAKSKYYKYGVSDLKKSFDFAAQVNDWKLFDNNETFITKLKEKHHRKIAFWSQTAF
jgi:hypothetical protein